jgi:hypothetical protein
MSSAIDPTNVFDPLGTVRQQGSLAGTTPAQSSTTTPFFPAVCLSTHWDPTRIYARTVPTQLVSLPVDFRPYTKVCLDYRTSAPEQAAPEVPDNLVFPGGGDQYPPTRYINNIDRESLLRRLDRPLGTCDPDQYYPPKSGDMYVDGMLVPRTPKLNSRFVDELSMPQALLRNGNYDCRAQADKINWERSPRLFNNTTKQDRYTAPSSVEKPRQNIWATQLRCTDTPLSTHKTANGQRAWGPGSAAGCQLKENF